MFNDESRFDDLIEQTIRLLYSSLGIEQPIEDPIYAEKRRAMWERIARESERRIYEKRKISKGFSFR